MTTRKLLGRTFITVMVILLTSCSSYKKVPYLQESSSFQDMELKTLAQKSAIRFQPEDVISITVNASREPSVAAAFNLPLQPQAVTETSGDNVPQGYGRQTYLVNQEGKIDFPILGQINVLGLSKDELESYLKKALTQYMKEEPVVTIRLTNQKISILGEVNHPGQFNVTRDKTTIFDALALAGDMTVYGKRENVLLMRENSHGEINLLRLNLNSTEIVTSPYFYLQQNDVVYVEPNKAKAKSADVSAQTSILISLGSLVLGIVNLAVLIAK